MEGDPYEYATGESVMWSTCETCKQEILQDLLDQERKAETHTGELYDE